MTVKKLEQERAATRDTITTAQGIAGKSMGKDLLWEILTRFDRGQLAQLSGLPLSEVNDLFNPPEDVQENVHKLDIEMPGGLVLRNIQNDEDTSRAIQILTALNLTQDAITKLAAGPNPQPKTVEPVVAQEVIPTAQAGTTIQEMVPRFATRKKNKLSPKALYEYGNYHRKFVDWLQTRKKSKHIPVHSITRTDVADFIDDLLHEKLSERTISKKYLPAINGLFDLAQTIGVIPKGQELVSRGHNVFSKADQKKADVTKGYKPFTQDELKRIFQPQLLSNAQRPADFWLPMLGLFTGGRVSELAQLDIADIQQHEGIWAISINGEGDKSLKTLAAARLIPLHPTLIDCGFLDYVNDVKVHGGKLFPYITPDTFGSYGATPSERWGKYLDTLDIKDKQKVFHSFRSTSNDCLKQNGVPEESRCQFIGHEHDTVNSTSYSTPHNLSFLLENVASKLEYPFLNFTALKYQPGQFSEMLGKLCIKKARLTAHRNAKRC